MKRALLFVTLLAASLLSIFSVNAPSAVAATCQTPFATAGYPPGWTQLSGIPDPWDQTDGNVIAADFLYTPGGPYVAIGGNFTIVHDPTQGAVPVRNLAVIRLSDGHVMWGTGAMVGYPKTIQARNGVLYVGGSISSINGIARHAIAAFNAFNYNLLPWQPAVAGGTIRSIQISDFGVVYLGGNGSVMAFRTDTAAKVWSVPAYGGVVNALLLTPDQTSLYVGGRFSRLGVASPNGLAQLTAAGAVTGFNAHMRPSSPGLNDGELVIDLHWDLMSNPLRLIVGTGGSHTNSVKEVEPYFGGWWWSHDTEGDTQATMQLGNTILSGNHRSHGNVTTGCPYNFFGIQWANQGFVLPWNPGLSGNPTYASYLSEANGGISDFLVEPNTRRVYVFGDFSVFGASCPYDTQTIPVCSGGSTMRGIARYGY